MLLEFTNCDALEILHKDGDLSYRWEAKRSPETLDRFEVLPDSPLEILIDRLEYDKPLRQLCQLIISGADTTELPCFTGGGSFWTDNINNLPKLVQKAINLAPETEEISREIYCSIAILPFLIDPDNTGLIILKTMKPFFFTRHEIQFYEGIAQTLGLASADRRAQAALRERVKELTCLYRIARIAEQEDSALEEKLQQIVEILPSSWQHPDIAVARIATGDFVCTSPSFSEGRYRQTAKIGINGNRRGLVEVIYTDDKPELEAMPFLKEEASLIEEVARQISSIIEKDETQKEKVKLQAQLRHADRLATIGQLAAAVAHELNEPLGSILGFAQLAKKNLPDTPGTDQAASLQRDLEKIEKASLQARNIIREMLIFARQMPTKKTSVNLNKLVGEALSFFESRCKNNGIELHFQMSDTLPNINADPAQVNQLLINLIVNAIQAMPQGGSLTIITDHDGNNLSMEVKDTGMGMSEETRKQIFDPFFTTKDVRQGTGLGLSVVHGIVTSHDGTIQVESTPDCGSSFKVHLPISTQGKKMEKK